MNSKQAAAGRPRIFNRAAAMLTTFLVALMLAASATAQPSTRGVTNVFFAKTFGPDTIGPGSVSTLTFEINSESPEPVTGLAFTDTLPAALNIAAPAFVSNTCGGTLTALEGGDTITFSGGSVGANASCQITVDVTGTTPGPHQNVSGDLTSSAGNSGSASATLTIATDRPGFTKSFSPAMVQFGVDSTLTFSIDNSANGGVESGLSFTDALPSGLQVASLPNTTNDCNGTLTAAAGSTTISYIGGFILANSSCTISVDVETTAVGRLDNRTSDLNSSAGNSGKASDSLTVVVDELALVKDFIDNPAFPGGTSTLEFSITNLDRNDSVTDITFTDNLDATLSGLVAVPPLPVDPCGTGSSLSGTSLLTLTDATLSPGENCTFQVTLQVPAGATPGSFPNTTSMISGNDSGGTVLGSGASDTLVVDVFPILTKTFLNDPVGAGGTTDVEFTITNTSAGSSATAISFFDNLSNFLTGITPVGLPMAACNGTLVQRSNFPTFGTNSLFLGSGAGSTPGSLGPGESCSFIVTLQIPAGTPTGTFTNATSQVTATVDGETRTGPPTSDTLDVVSAPRLSKSFTDDPVDPGATVTLEFTLTHSEFAPGDATDIAFTDDLDAALAGLVATGLPQTDICGTGSQLAGDPDASNLSFTGGSLSPGESCTFSVTLQVPLSAAPGFHTNTTSEVTATVDGLATTGLAASDDLLISAVELTKLFIGDPVLPGASLPLRFTITNDNPDFDATNINFSDNLDEALPGLVATGLPLNDICGTGSEISGTSNLTFTGGTLAAGTSCTFDVTVQVPAGADSNTYFNVTSPLVATLDGVPIAFNTAQDDLVVDADLLALTKEFTDDPAIPGGTVTLEFTLTNASATDTISSIAFTDNLEAVFAGLVSESGTQMDVCGAGSQLAGTSVLSLTGAGLAPGAACTFSATLRIPAGASGNALNTTSTVTGDVEGVAVEGVEASDTLRVNNVTFDKSFSGPTTATGTVTLSFTLENLDAGNGVSGLSFTDNLDAVIAGLIATGTPLTDVCGAGSQLGGTSVLTLTGGSLDPGASCSFDVLLQVPATATPGSFNNTTSNLSSNGLPASGPASATLQIEPPPSFGKVFLPNTVAVGGTTTLTFTIDNGASAVTANSLAFTDNLPAGLEVAGAPNASTTCGGTLTAAAGAGTIELGGGSVAAGSQCTIQIDIVGTAEGTFVNTTSALTSTSGDSGTASDTIDVVTGDFVMTKSFRTEPVLPAGLVEMELSFVNGSDFALTDIALSDDLEAVMPGLAAEGLPITDECGAGSQLSGTSTVTLTGGNLPAGGSCTVVVPVRLPADAPTGTFTNTTSIATGTREGVAVEAPADSADLVVEPLAFTKTFAPAIVAAGSTTTATFEITNPDPANAVTGLAFTDDLEAFVPGMTAANTPINDACGAGSLVDGTSTIALTDGTLAAGGSCSFQVVLNIPADTAAGEFTNTTSTLTSSVGGTQTSAAAASGVLGIQPAPTFAKTFSPATIAPGETSTLTFTIDNSASQLDADSLAFDDNLPAGVAVAAAPAVSNTCGGTLTADAGTGFIGLTGGSVAQGATCQIQVDITANASGTFTNISGDLTSSLGNSGNATAALTVSQAIPVPLFNAAWLGLLTLLLATFGWHAVGTARP